MILDLSILTGFLAGMFFNVYLASRRIGMDKRKSQYLVLTISIWVIPFVLWFAMSLHGVCYTYEAGPDLSFSKLLYPVHAFFFLFPQARFLLVLVAVCPFLILGASLVLRRQLLSDRGNSGGWRRRNREVVPARKAPHEITNASERGNENYTPADRGEAALASPLDKINKKECK